MQRDCTTSLQHLYEFVRVLFDMSSILLRIVASCGDPIKGDAVLYFRISTPDHSNHSTSALDMPAKRKIVPKVFSSLDPGPDPVPPAGSPSSVSVSSVLYQMENCEIVFSIFFHLGQKFNVSEALGR